MRVIKRVSQFFVAIFLIAVCFLVVFDPQVSLENEFLLFLFNTLFIGLLPIIVSVFAARTYLKNNVTGAFYLFVGMFIFGLGCIMAGICSLLDIPNNVFVTVHNMCSLASSIAILMSSFSEAGHTVIKKSRKNAILLVGFVASCLFIYAMIMLPSKGLTTPFFNESGFTKTRSAVLFSAVALYFAASMNHIKQYQKNRRDYHYWYALALLLISLGLLVVGLSETLGTPLNWAGRVSQYLGAVFALVSMAAIYRKAADKKTPFTDIMTDFFSDAEESYTSLINSAPDAVLTIDQDFHIFIVNPSAAALFQIKPDEAVGVAFLELLEQPYRDQLREDIQNYHTTGVSSLIGQTAEMTARDLTGRVFPIEISFAVRRLSDHTAITMIIRDITQRKLSESVPEAERAPRAGAGG